jgi:hypothetical protein
MRGTKGNVGNKVNDLKTTLGRKATSRRQKDLTILLIDDSRLNWRRGGINPM